LPGAGGAPPPEPPEAKPSDSGRSAKEQLQQQQREAAKRQAERAAAEKRTEEKEQAEVQKKKDEADQLKCHLHKKANGKCKFCQRHKEALENVEKFCQAQKAGNDPKRRKTDRAASEERDDGRRGPIPLVNPKTYGMAGLLQTHIVECAHHKSLLTLENFDQVIDEAYQFANSVEPYMANSSTVPSALFCCLHRFFTMNLDSRQLRRLVDNLDSPYIRCCGFLYVRFGLAPDQLWNWLGEFVLDEEEFKPTPEGDFKTTIGEYVESLLTQEKYYSTVLPRLPMATKRQLEEKLAGVVQFRKRGKANRELLDDFRQSGTKVEACVGVDEWLEGRVVEVLDEVPTRIRLAIRFEDSTEELIDLGKVIINDGKPPKPRPSGGGQAGRGRSRSRSPRVDWSREKGRTTKELVDELRSRDREKAVCSTGKDYARKPVGYKAACALARDQGKASTRLMEEETFVAPRARKQRTPSPQRDSIGGKRPSAEHQARMQALFEKYSTQKGQDGGGSGKRDEVDGGEFLRLG